MGFWDKKWLIEYKYSKSLFDCYLKATMNIKAKDEYDAKAKAKKLLSYQYTYFEILSISEVSD